MMNIGERSKRMRKMELRITAHKREIKDFPKLPSATSQTPIPVSEILTLSIRRRYGVC